MFVIVYVDYETFHNLVIENADFDACLTQDRFSCIQVSVPTNAVYTTSDNDIVTIKINAL